MSRARGDQCLVWSSRRHRLREGRGSGPRRLASRVARFSRRAGLHTFASLDAVCAIVGNPAERLRASRQHEEGGHVVRAPATNADVNPLARASWGWGSF